MGRKLLRPIFQPKSRGARGRFHLKGPFAGPVGGGVGATATWCRKESRKKTLLLLLLLHREGKARQRNAAPSWVGPTWMGLGLVGLALLKRDAATSVPLLTWTGVRARAQREEGTLSSTAGSCCASGQGWRRRRILSCDGAGGGDLLGRAGPHGWQQHWLSAHGLPCLSSESLEEEEEEEEDRPTCSRRRRRSIDQHQREARCQPAAL